MARREGIDPEELVGKSTPAPDMPVEYSLYVTAFLALDSEREYLRPIPWTAKAAYCSFYELDKEQTDYLMELITRVDNAVLVEREKKAKRDGKNANGPSKSNVRVGGRNRGRGQRA